MDEPSDASTPESVGNEMRELGVWWPIAGGWAIDLWLGTVTRAHHDLEVIIQRGDQHVLRRRLGEGWRFSCIDPPGSGWRHWRPGHALTRPAFQAKVQRRLFEFDVFLEDVDAGVWTFRRDARIRRSVEEVVTDTASRLPVVRPEVQLLYMARRAESKNERDFVLALPHLGADDRRWLRDSLATSEPGHAWIESLDSAPPVP